MISSKSMYAHCRCLLEIFPLNSVRPCIILVLTQQTISPAKIYILTFVIGRFLRFGDSHISGLRSKNLECNFGLSWFSESRKMQFSPQIVLIIGNEE